MSSHKSKHSTAKSAGSSKAAIRKGANLDHEKNRIHADRYQMLIEAVADGFYEVGLNGNFRFFNDALSRIFGYSRK